jgi:hypothetical protein
MGQHHERPARFESTLAKMTTNKMAEHIERYKICAIIISVHVMGVDHSSYAHNKSSPVDCVTTDYRTFERLAIQTRAADNVFGTAPLPDIPTLKMQ